MSEETVKHYRVGKRDGSTVVHVKATGFDVEEDHVVFRGVDLDLGLPGEVTFTTPKDPISYIADSSVVTEVAESE